MKSKKARKPTEQQQKCMECRECCEYVEFPVTMLSDQVIDYYLIRGNKFYIDQPAGIFMVRMKDPCKHLTKDGCAIYKDRPYTCRNYMCSQGDKSVKAMKEAACRECMDATKQNIEAARKEIKKREQGK